LAVADLRSDRPSLASLVPGKGFRPLFAWHGFSVLVTTHNLDSEDRMNRFIAALLASALGAACATAGPVPNDRLAASEASVRGAQEAGAGKTPQAQLHLKLAADEIAQAKQLISEKKNDEAGRALDCAKADAELAVGLAREAQARADAKQAVEQITLLQQGNK
jgi:hypothetical protein